MKLFAPVAGGQLEYFCRDSAARQNALERVRAQVGLLADQVAQGFQQVNQVRAEIRWKVGKPRTPIRGKKKYLLLAKKKIRP